MQNAAASRTSVDHNAGWSSWVAAGLGVAKKWGWKAAVGFTKLAAVATVGRHLAPQGVAAQTFECQGQPDYPNLVAFDNAPIVIPPAICNTPDRTEPGTKLTITSKPSWVDVKLREYPFSPVEDVFPLPNDPKYFMITNNGVLVVQYGASPDIDLFNMTDRTLIGQIRPDDIPGYVAPSGPVRSEQLMPFKDNSGFLATLLFGGVMAADLRDPLHPRLSHHSWPVKALAVSEFDDSFYAWGGINGDISSQLGIIQYNLTDFDNQTPIRSHLITDIVNMFAFGPNGLVALDNDNIFVFEGNGDGFEVTQSLLGVGGGNPVVNYAQKQFTVVNRSNKRVTVYAWQCDQMPCEVSRFAESTFDLSVEFAVYLESNLLAVVGGNRLLLVRVTEGSLAIEAEYARDEGLGEPLELERPYLYENANQLWVSGPFGAAGRLLAFKPTSQLLNLATLTPKPQLADVGQCASVALEYQWGGGAPVPDEFELCVQAQPDRLAALPSIAQHVNQSSEVVVKLSDFSSPDGHVLSLELTEESPGSVSMLRSDGPVEIASFNLGLAYNGIAHEQIKLSYQNAEGQLWVVYRHGFMGITWYANETMFGQTTIDYEVLGKYEGGSTTLFSSERPGAILPHGGLLLPEDHNKRLSIFDIRDPNNITITVQRHELGVMQSVSLSGNNFFGVRFESGGDGATEALAVFSSSAMDQLELATQYLPAEGKAITVAVIGETVYLVVAPGASQNLVQKLTYQTGKFTLVDSYVMADRYQIVNIALPYIFMEYSGADDGFLMYRDAGDQSFEEISALPLLDSLENLIQITPELYVGHVNTVGFVMLDLRNPFVPRILHTMPMANGRDVIDMLRIGGLEFLLTRDSPSIKIFAPSLGTTFDTAAIVHFNQTGTDSQGDYTWGLQTRRLDGSISATSTATLQVLDYPATPNQAGPIELSAITLGRAYSPEPIILSDVVSDPDNSLRLLDVEGATVGSRPPFWLNFDAQTVPGQVRLFGTKPTGSAHDLLVVTLVIQGWSGAPPVRVTVTAPTANQLPVLSSVRDIEAFANQWTELPTPVVRDDDGDTLFGPVPIFSVAVSDALRPRQVDGRWEINPNAPGELGYYWLAGDGIANVTRNATATAPRRAPAIDAGAFSTAFLGIAKPGGQECANISAVYADADGLAVFAEIQTVSGGLPVATSLVDGELCFSPPAGSLGKTPLLLVAESGSGATLRTSRMRFDVESLDAATLVARPIARHTFEVARPGHVPVAQFADADDALTVSTTLPVGAAISAGEYHWTPSTPGTYEAEACAQPVERPAVVPECSLAEWRVVPSLRIATPDGVIMRWTEGIAQPLPIIQLEDAIWPLTVVMRISNSEFGALEVQHAGDTRRSVVGELRVEALSNPTTVNAMLASAKFVPTPERNRADDFTVAVRFQDSANPEVLVAVEGRGTQVPTAPAFIDSVADGAVAAGGEFILQFPVAVLHDPGQAARYELGPADVLSRVGGSWDPATRTLTTAGSDNAGRHSFEYCAQDIGAGREALRTCFPWHLRITPPPSLFEQMADEVSLPGLIAIGAIGIASLVVLVTYTIKSFQLKTLVSRMDKAAQRLATHTSRYRAANRGQGIEGMGLSQLESVIQLEAAYLIEAIGQLNIREMSECLMSLTLLIQKVYFSGHVMKAAGLMELVPVWGMVERLIKRLESIADEGCVSYYSIALSNTTYLLVTLLMASIRAGRPLAYSGKRDAVSGLNRIIARFSVIKGEAAVDQVVLYLRRSLAALRSMDDRDSCMGKLLCCFASRRPWSDMGLMGRLLVAAAGLNPGDVVKEFVSLAQMAPVSTFLKPWLVEQMQIAAVSDKDSLHFVLREVNNIVFRHKDSMRTCVSLQRAPDAMLMLMQVLVFVFDNAKGEMRKLVVTGFKEQGLAYHGLKAFAVALGYQEGEVKQLRIGCCGLGRLRKTAMDKLFSAQLLTRIDSVSGAPAMHENPMGCNSVVNMNPVQGLTEPSAEGGLPRQTLFGPWYFVHGKAIETAEAGRKRYFDVDQGVDRSEGGVVEGKAAPVQQNRLSFANKVDDVASWRRSSGSSRSGSPSRRRSRLRLGTPTGSPASTSRRAEFAPVQAAVPGAVGGSGEVGSSDAAGFSSISVSGSGAGAGSA